MAGIGKTVNIKVLDSNTYRSFYGESIHIKSSTTNLYVSLLSDDREMVSERAKIVDENGNIIFTGEVSDKGFIRVREATFGMPIQIALSMVGAILQHIKINNPNILIDNFITLSSGNGEEQIEQE